jgi:hypothetical protein
MYARVTNAEPPTKRASLTGLAATVRRLSAPDRRAGRTRVAPKLLPRRVASNISNECGRNGENEQQLAGCRQLEGVR